MFSFNKIELIKKHISELKGKNKTIGFVPTMGALHQGHISLIEKARAENDVVVSSIFVNPIQFNDKSDFEKYPKTIESDCEKLKNACCDIVFIPTVNEMYPELDNSKFDFGYISTTMEGAFRPGHFNGVAIVVKKLFEIVTPDNAYFGEKDFQQFLIIKKLTKILNFPINIVPCEIIREPDGLAMSSRNIRLSDEERTNAAKVPQILSKLKSLKRKMSVAEMKYFVFEEVNKIQNIKLEYFDIVDKDTLLSVKNWHNFEDTICCIAFYSGTTRLIDNLKF